MIKTEEEYRSALERIDKLMDAEPGTEEFDELELLAKHVDNYESEVYPIGLPDRFLSK